MSQLHPQMIKAPQGSQLNCLGWVQEAAYRMIQNNLDSNVAENPEELIVYGGLGKAARNWDCYTKILQELKNLKNNETLLIQSGKPVAVFRSHEDAPRVLLCNSLLVPHWATWEVFHELDKKGLMMYGQMTAGSWIYIGTQGIVQGTYETFMSAGRKHFNGSLEGRLIVSGGLGGMGGAQPLAAKMAGGVFLGIDMDRSRIEKRLKSGYLDIFVNTLDEALAIVYENKKKKQAVSIGLEGNILDVLEELLKRNVSIDLLTDQTSAHDELNGYYPQGYSIDQALTLRKEDPKKYVQKSYETMIKHVQAMTEFKKRGSHVFDYGNNLRGQALKAGYSEAFAFPGFVPEYIRPMFCEGKGPFRWVALSGDPNDIYLTDQVLREAFPENQTLQRWLDLAQKHIHFQGLPARICWLGYEERVKAGVLLNQLVSSGKVKAPLVIGRDHLDCGSVASPYRETEAMKDGSDAVGDWPVLNALINAVNGASWVSVHHGGGVGMGYSLHSGMVIVADGTPEAETRIRRVLNSDPGMGIVRHVDAGYDEACSFYKKKKNQEMRIPGMESS